MTESETFELSLTGLDGSNPLGFFATLGVLEATTVPGGPIPRLRWQHQGTWHPILSSVYSDIDGLIARLDSDRNSCLAEPALDLIYGRKRDLKPPPEEFRKYLLERQFDTTPSNRRGADWASAFGTDIAVDNNGNTKPTALHFTAGQQQFLQMVRELCQEVRPDDLREALVGPWLYARSLPVLGWDATSSRDYALRASDPSTDKKLGVPGADFLAVRGLSCLPAVPVASRIVTTGCKGGWKDGRFRWPIWVASITLPVVRTLLRQNLEAMSRPERAERGIGAVFTAGIKRSDQGGYGSFEPSVAI